jgi:hypothetical protein
MAYNNSPSLNEMLMQIGQSWLQAKQVKEHRQQQALENQRRNDEIKRQATIDAQNKAYQDAQMQNMLADNARLEEEKKWGPFKNILANLTPQDYADFTARGGKLDNPQAFQQSWNQITGDTVTPATSTFSSTGAPFMSQQPAVAPQWMQGNVSPDFGFGQRWDEASQGMNGPNKGTGYFGMMPMQDGSGKYASEIGGGIDVNGRNMEVPSLVPTLSPDEIILMLSGGNPTQNILQKVAEYATQRTNQGRSPFAGPGESPPQGYMTKQQGFTPGLPSPAPQGVAGSQPDYSAQTTRTQVPEKRTQGWRPEGTGIGKILADANRQYNSIMKNALNVSPEDTNAAIDTLNATYGAYGVNFKPYTGKLGAMSGAKVGEIKATTEGIKARTGLTVAQANKVRAEVSFLPKKYQLQVAEANRKWSHWANQDATSRMNASTARINAGTAQGRLQVSQGNLDARWEQIRSGARKAATKAPLTGIALIKAINAYQSGKDSNGNPYSDATKAAMAGQIEASGISPQTGQSLTAAERINFGLDKPAATTKPTRSQVLTRARQEKFSPAQTKTLLSQFGY